jgi:UDP-glucose 4-epimerase
MKTLIVGGAGYIGSHVVLDLVQHGEEVVVIDDLSTGFRELLPDSVALVQGDFGNAELLDDVIARHGVNAIIHFAAKIVVPESVSDPLRYYLNNTSKARTLIEVAVKHGIKHFIFSSTAAVYGDAREMPVTEETATVPVSPYGRSKLMVEWMLQDSARAYGLTPVILRYFNVAGADPLGRSGQITRNSTHLIKVAAEAVTGVRDGMRVYGTDYPTADGTCVRDYIHVSDLARAHALALDYLRQNGQSTVLNCAYGRGYSVLDVLKSVKHVSGVDFPTEMAPRRPGDPATIIASGEKIRSVLGWQPQFDDLDQIVAHALAWEKHLISSSFNRNEA